MRTQKASAHNVASPKIVCIMTDDVVREIKMSIS